MVRVKICGITNLDSALFAAECGADALGFVFWEKSLRFISTEAAREIIKGLPPFITTVGVFVDEPAENINRAARDLGLACVQLHGEETPEGCKKIEAKVIKAVRIKDKGDINGLGRFNVSAILLDTYREGVQGGSGEVFNWDIAAEAKRYGRIILSGGLTPANVVSAIRRVSPYAVDVSSGVEVGPGKKDPDKVRDFISKVRGLEEEFEERI